MQRTHVSFEADFPESAPGPQMPNADLVSRIVDCLRETGFTVEDPSWTEYAWELRVSFPRGGVDCQLGLYDDGHRQWLLTTEAAPLLRDRILRRNGVVEDHERLCKAIHRILSGDDRFRAVRWYTKEEWNRDCERSWGSEP